MNPPFPRIKEGGKFVPEGRPMNRIRGGKARLVVSLSDTSKAEKMRETKEKRRQEKARKVQTNRTDRGRQASLLDDPNGQPRGFVEPSTRWEGRVQKT